MAHTFLMTCHPQTDWNPKSWTIFTKKTWHVISTFKFILHQYPCQFPTQTSIFQRKSKEKKQILFPLYLHYSLKNTEEWWVFSKMHIPWFIPWTEIENLNIFSMIFFISFHGIYWNCHTVKSEEDSFYHMKHWNGKKNPFRNDRMFPISNGKKIQFPKVFFSLFQKIFLYSSQK